MNKQRAVKKYAHISKSGWLQDAQHCPSPNYDKRPEQFLHGHNAILPDNSGALHVIELPCIELVVIHAISLPAGCFEGDTVQHFFQNNLDCNSNPAFAVLEDVFVSTHLFIRRTGDLQQFVSLFDRAWHAGKSQFQEKSNCNDFSIGIELEGDDRSPFTRAQYQVLVRVLRRLCALWGNVTHDKILGHQHIAPERKTDPGPFFRWEYLFKKLALHNF